MKVLHLADLHARDKDIEEIEKCLNFILETARQEKPDLAINAGDTFDSGDIKLDSRAAKLIVRFFSELADICPVAVVIGTPSHDGMAAEILRYVKGMHFVTVSSIPEQFYLYREELYRGPPIGNIPLEAIVTLIPQPTKQWFQGSDHDISAAMSAVFMGFGAQAAQHPGVPHILAGHWNVSGARLSSGQVLTGQDIEIAIDQMMLAAPSFVCLGHIHLPQKINNIFYSGSIYPCNWGENHDHGFFIHEIGELPRFINAPCRKMVRFSNDYTSSGGIPDNLLELMAPEQDITGAHVRLDLKVYQDEAAKIDKQAIEAAIMHTAASCDIRIIRIPRVTVRSETVLKLERLRDKIKEMAAIKEEEVCETILSKADQLEDGSADALLAEITGGAA